MSTTPPATAPQDPRTSREIRADLGTKIEAMTEPFMMLLGIVFLACLILDYSVSDMPAANRKFLQEVETAIYWIFAIDFLILLLLATDRWKFIKHNVLIALSLVMPALRPLRLFRSLTALRTVTATRALGVIDRSIDNVRGVFAGRAMSYMIILTIVVTLVGAGLTYQFDRGHPNTDLTSYGEAVWWGATLITTINSGLDPVSAWGRVVGMIMRIYAMGVFGYLTASIATYFIRQVSQPSPTTGQQGTDPASAVEQPQSTIPALRHPPTTSGDSA